MVGAVRTGDREEPMSSEASSSVISMREARRSRARCTTATSGPMVREYTEARGMARAYNAHARLSPGDRI
jgi:hypothetical protein